ncbi:hypothetical protein BT96DRAFT_1022579 [Gymnopus androsaceus JB14]|uniref:Uncharacterized protein n=1 Tax=Gymnopus androsaceus JB14 TaxID=1447944 RepID=A0A6A4H844_9AGAR|nr:hypothetical protein BT96DRAFT_1022579 [Gymnopus androsaceus JB14]
MLSSTVRRWKHGEIAVQRPDVYLSCTYYNIKSTSPQTEYLPDEGAEDLSPTTVSFTFMFQSISRPTLARLRLQLRKMSDNTGEKVLSDWIVRADPAPDQHLRYFMNNKLKYYSYIPPPGYTAEEILQFRGGKRLFKTVEGAQVHLDKKMAQLKAEQDDRLNEEAEGHPQKDGSK